jgi:hypothetical protein
LAGGRGCEMTTCRCNTLRLAMVIVSHGELVSIKTGFTFIGLQGFFFSQIGSVTGNSLQTKRFKQVISGLGQVQEWNKTERTQRGEEPGSICDIDMRYGSEPLELDMTKLFRPLIQFHSNSPPVLMTAGRAIHSGGAARHI